jgi:hypothetical protein
MKNTILLGCMLIQATASQAQTLDLPPRPATAPEGAEFARSIADLPLKEREERILEAVRAGNVPASLRALVPITIEAGTDRLTYFVTADYLSIGSDQDDFLAPLTPDTAQRIADRLDCMLPTPRMVDEIYRRAAMKRTPSPIPPSPAMTTVPVFLRHHQAVLAQAGGKKPGALVAGHKKDVVIANKVFDSPGKVAIYGWHRPDGTPIQPLYTGHAASWVDYSHGIRLVQRRMIVNGAAKPIDEVLADPRLAPLLSNEGVMRRTRYELTPSPAQARPEAPRTVPGETVHELRLKDGVRVVINEPEPRPSKPPLLVLYALPNGGTTEQAIGKRLRPGDDWRHEIQHIAAQTRFLRAQAADRNLVVAYLENDLKSWPAWRRKHGDAGIPAILDAIRKRFAGAGTRVVLTGHSGGGSLTFGYLNAVDVIPDEIERIAFLDSNYAYDTGRHRDKLTAWLKASDRGHLVVLAYDDAAALLNGKPFVSESGGTWGRSRLMLRDLEESFRFTKDDHHDLRRCRALDGRVTFLLKANPDRKILHTVQVERNGFIEGILAGTRLEEVGYTYMGDRAYDRFIRSD